MFRKSAIAAAILILVSPRLFALGLGEIDMQSALNQSMQAAIDLTSAAGTDLADIKVSLASLQAHQRVGLTKTAVLASFRFSVEQDGAGGAVVRITSSELIREPYLEFLLELEWPKGRLLRQYTVLVDPPVTMPATPVAPQAPVTRAATPQPARQISPPPAVPSTAPTVVSVAPAAADEYGPIRRSDTLWSIADRLRPDSGVSVQQMMQALLRANPRAFINNNINQMKAGVTLKLPGREEILSMSAREALAESRRQYSEWKAANAAASVPEPAPAAPAQAAPEPAVDEATEAAAATEAVPEPEAAAVPAESRLSLVAPEGDSVAGAAAPGDEADAEIEPGSIADINMQLALASEEAEAGRAQSRELESRVAELEQQIDTMKRLLELKDHALAQLQGSAANEQAAPAGEADVSASESLAEDEGPRGIMGRLMDNPLLAGAGVLVAILLGGFLWAANRQKNQAGMFDEDLPLGKRLDQEAGRDAQKHSPSIDVNEQSWAGDEEQPVNAGEQDALSAADVYLAYGRIQQAEDVLQAALQDDPDNDACQLKLLEVYHTAGNVVAFERAASDYRDGVTADDSRWLKVAEMGRALAPHNDLFMVATDSGAEFDMDLTGMDHAPATGGNYDKLPDSIDFGLDDAGVDEQSEEGLLASEDEVTTKLDLARAYIDMDDQESARSILGEVMQEGNADQKQEAEKIFGQLA
jgi:pilus assembly protein FimV